jgi:hypothetical protein
MNNSNTILSKHIWSKDETVAVTRCYLNGKSIQEAHLLVPNIKLSSLKMKYANCLYLDKGAGPLALKNYCKMHKDVWDELKDALTVPDVESESTIDDEESTIEDEETVEYDAWGDKIHKEDGETYFKCTGTCNKVLHYEDTDGEGMCGKCQYENEKKGKSKSRRK